jgi:DNA/RNA endonuclease G (NUC1)
VVSIGRLPDKERRKARRFNHVARDLRTPKYAMRVVNNKQHELRIKKRDSWNEDQEDE